jgi:UDPglucose--hexose-1-phosphate uridylyltransferase
LVCANEDFAAIVPFWAVWPFETIVIPRRHAACLPELSVQERDSLANILKRLTARYDAVFETPFPYSMGSISGPPMARLTLSGTCTLIFIRLCFAPRPYANSWLAMKCSPRRRGT